MPSSPELAALLVVGDARDSAQRALDSLNAQTMAAAMEIVVVDLSSREPLPLTLPERVPTRYVRLPTEASWAKARAVAARRARAPVLAFLEPHSTAAPSWAEAVVRAHRRGWAAVGYAFRDPRPASYRSRAILLSKYGAWRDPTATRRARLLPCGNVSYDREALLALGDELESLLTPDFGIHERFAADGRAMGVESEAVVANDSSLSMRGLVAASFLCCRLLAAHRARNRGWSRARRLGYAVATPVVSPAVALGRLAVAEARGSVRAGELVACLPVLLLKAVASALGESAGYLAGSGAAERRFVHWEVHVDRSGRLGGAA